MTNKLMLSVERELLLALAEPASPKERVSIKRHERMFRLRGLLNKQSCGACGGCDNGCKLDRESPQVEPAAPHQGEPVAKLGVHHVLGAIHNVPGFPGVKGNHIHDLTALLNGVLNGIEKPAPVVVVMPEFESAFEAWWESDGQYCRAGGGSYEKTFAYRAYEAALAEVTRLNTPQ